MVIPSCCLKAFQWNGVPTGTIGKLSSNPCYITTPPSPSPSPSSKNPKSAILLIHDLLGWAFPNTRLLADHLALETHSDVYVPDFFSGEGVDREHVLAGRFDKIPLGEFIGKNSREIREPEIFECARVLRVQYPKVGAVGYCYGGWAVFRLGAQSHDPPLVDCISAGHPSMMSKKDIDEVAVPVQLLCPELDKAFDEEMKMYAFSTIMKRGVPFDYQHFEGVEHSCLVRGDENVQGEREAMVRGKNAAVAWFKEFLNGDE